MILRGAARGGHTDDTPVTQGRYLDYAGVLSGVVRIIIVGRHQQYGVSVPMGCAQALGSALYDADCASVRVTARLSRLRESIMSILGKLFGRRTQPDTFVYAQAMEEMANEGERTHRGMLAVYNDSVAAGLLPRTTGAATAAPTGRGIYKARLFAALFMAYAFVRSGASESDGEEMMNIASGVAMKPAQGPGEPSLARNEAANFTIDFIKAVFPAIDRAVRTGPGVPGAPSAELETLAGHLHDALADSIGRQRYTDAVRERFAVMIQGNVVAAMNHASQWVK